MSCGCCCRDKDKAAEKAILKIHLKALDDLVSVNSLFTIAVFVWLSYAHAGKLTGLENPPECNADSGVAKRLVVYGVVSFGLFLLSSLVAKTLKVHFSLHRKDYFGKDPTLDRKKKRCRNLMFAASGTILGCFFLTLSMINVIQIRLGKLSYGSKYTIVAVASLVTIVAIALGIYTYTMTQAIFATNNELQLAVSED